MKNKKSLLLLILLLTSFTVWAEDNETSPERVFLWSPEPRQLADDYREGALELEKFLRRELADYLPQGVKVVTGFGYDDLLHEIKRGQAKVIQADYSVYFGQPEGSQKYKPFLQAVAPLAINSATGEARKTIELIRGVILTRRDSGLRILEDLRGRQVGVLHRYASAGCLYPVALMKAGELHPGRDLTLLEVNDTSRGVKALFTGVLDALCLPEGAAEKILRWENQTDLIAELYTIASTRPVLPGGFLYLTNPTEPDYMTTIWRETLREFYGPRQLLPAKADYYPGIKELLIELEENLKEL